MTAEEFNYEFDLLYNNISNNQAPGLDVYEKSVFLTQAQDEILKAYASPKTNKLQEGIDDSERRQIDFSRLLRIKEYTKDECIKGIGNLWKDSYVINISDSNNNNPFYIILNEQVLVNRNINGEKNADAQYILNNYRLQVIPLSYIDYTQIQSRDDYRPPKNQAYRMININPNQNIGLSNKTQYPSIEILLGRNDTLVSYTIRYLKKPYPIILEDLSPLGLSIDGKDKPLNTLQTEDYANDSPCELDPIIHKEILQRAVELAKASYVSTELGTTLALGQQSKTPMGMVTSNK